MKRGFRYGIGALLAIFALGACSKDSIENVEIPITDLSIDPASATLYVDDELELGLIIEPANATETAVEWTSTNTKVAEVDSEGLVVALAPGNARIRVSTPDGKVTATCTIKVVEKTIPAIPVTGVELDKTSATLEIGETLVLTATVSPAEADNREINWSSSDASVASVDGGTVTARAAGSAVITVTTLDGGFKASCTVTVNKAAGEDPDDDPEDDPDTKTRVRWEDTGADVPALPSYNKVSSWKDFPRVDVTVSGSIQRETYKTASFQFSDPKNMYSKVADLSVTGQIRGRGNSTWDYADGGKKPYRIKFDVKNKVFGMGSDRDWILLAESMDPSQMRNMVAQRVARVISMDFSPRYRTVELYVNNSYLGNYVLMEQKETGLGHKVFVSPVDPASSETDGGYFVELDAKGDDPVQFWSATFNRQFNFKDPEEPNSAQKKFFQDLVNDVESAMKSKNWDKVHDLIEMDTWIQNYIVQELTMNVDGNMRLSTYFAKDKDTKLYIPMVWDFDLALGNASYLYKYCGTNGPEGWFIKDCGGGESNPYEKTYYQYLFQDPAFVSRLKELWSLYYPRLKAIDDSFIDGMTEYNAPAYQHAQDEDKIPRVTGYDKDDTWFATYQGAIDFMHDYYSERLSWLNSNINTL